ncbi:glycolipid transfer protein domain-containing protein 2 isoform X1 [Gadus morhua]|uniref:Glycolipid transfer protein domain containing 2b n=1 Tax=Gadus morhua TaxID=8049 RepID=A0A8C5A3S0_GADMO|nr:ceramide-1-phosphate transfer protein-like isoform X1 [Gadus morhua]
MQPRQGEESEDMGVKSKAAAAIVILLLFLGCLWLQGGLDYHWDSCLKSYNQVNNLNQLTNRSGSGEAEGPLRQEGCPGQTFQVSALLSHLQDASASRSDIMLQPYLSSWDELVRFMEALGPMVGLISNEIETKTTLIRQLALAVEEGPEAELRPDHPPARFAGTSGADDRGAYRSVRSMIQVELQSGLVDFHQTSDSGCRTLLRLHRALDWLRLFLEKLAETPASGTSGRLRSPSELCREAYQSTLAHHHTWFVRRAAELAFIALPERGFFYRLVCVQNQEELSRLLLRVVAAIAQVYDRTQGILEDNLMLDLP